VKAFCGAIKFSECAIEGSRAMVLTSGGPCPDAYSRNDGGERNSQYETFHDQIKSPTEWSVRLRSVHITTGD